MLLTEKRLLTVRPLARDEWLLLLDLQLEPKADTATFGKTPFGLVGSAHGENDRRERWRRGDPDSWGGINETNVLWK